MNRADIERRAALSPTWARSVYDLLWNRRLAMVGYWSTTISEITDPKALARAQKQLAEWNVPGEQEAILAELLEVEDDKTIRVAPGSSEHAGAD